MASNQVPDTATAVAPIEKLAYSLRELCAALSLNRVTVYRLEKKGLLRSVPGIRHKLFSRHEVERFLAGRTGGGA